MEKIKKIFGAFGKLLNGNAVTICLTSMPFLAIMTWMSYEDSKHTLRLLEQRQLLHIENIQLENTTKNQSRYMNEVTDILQQQGIKLREADDIIQQQNNIIRSLIMKLKELDEWPIKPIDPDKLARGRSEANFIQEGH